MRFYILYFLTLLLSFSFACSSDDSGLRNLGYEPDGIGFIESIENSDKAAFEIFLKNQSLINFKDKAGKTPLMAASAQKNSRFLSSLLQAGANIKDFDNSKRTPIHYAIKGSAVENIKILIDQGFDPNWQDNLKRDALSTFILQKDIENIEIFNLIVSNTTDLNRRDFESKTPLILAVEMNKTGYAKILIKHKVSPLAKDHKGKTAFDYALEQNEKGTIDHHLFEIIRDYTQDIKDKL